jgi:preprotein translocase subunit SecD
MMAAGVENARVSVTSASLTVTAPPEAGEALALLTRRGRVALYDWERSVVGPDGRPAPADERVTGGSAAGSARSLTKAQADARAARADRGRPVHAGDGRWFVLAGAPSLTNADIESAEAATAMTTNAPVVALLFTKRGRAKFTALTRRLARRGSARVLPGTAAVEANQHFAFVLDDQLLSVPYIDFVADPNGIDGSTGAQIEGGLASEAARQIAAMVTTGPLPAELVPGG